MTIIRSAGWQTTPDGDARGFIQAHRLRELWFHTGTACNLACNFCLEGSKPGDTRLGLTTLDDVRPYIDEALTLGVEQFSFTGGEPFVARDFVKILSLAASHRPCLVLTNATEALQQRLAALEPLVAAPNRVSFRISIDYSDEDRHDAGRGKGNFAKAIAGLVKLHAMGFAVSVARHMAPGEDKDAVERKYASLFKAHGLAQDLAIVAFPDFALPGSSPDVPDVTTACMTEHQTSETREQFMCAFSRMVVKRDGKMRVYACTLVDDDPDYDLGADLAGSIAERISMKHHRCYTCFAYGASCSEL